MQGSHAIICLMDACLTTLPDTATHTSSRSFPTSSSAHLGSLSFSASLSQLLGASGSLPSLGVRESEASESLPSFMGASLGASLGASGLLSLAGSPSAAAAGSLVANEAAASEAAAAATSALPLDGAVACAAVSCGPPRPFRVVLNQILWALRCVTPDRTAHAWPSALRVRHLCCPATHTLTLCAPAATNMLLSAHAAQPGTSAVERCTDWYSLWTSALVDVMHVEDDMLQILKHAATHRLLQTCNQKAYSLYRPGSLKECSIKRCVSALRALFKCSNPMSRWN